MYSVPIFSSPIPVVFVSLLLSIEREAGSEPLNAPIYHNGEPFNVDTFFTTMNDSRIQLFLSLLGVDGCFDCLSDMYHKYKVDKDGNSPQRVDMFSILSKIPGLSHLGSDDS